MWVQVPLLAPKIIKEYAIFFAFSCAFMIFICMRIRKRSDNDIIEAVKNCFSVAGTLKYLGYSCAGGNRCTVKEVIARLNLDTSHWTGQLWSKDKQLKEIPQRGSTAKPHLIRERGHRCEKCKNTEWFDVPIILEIHHIDGNKKNNVRENLQLLCPNCHSTTDSWRRKKSI
jgi:5-methylcytosine-specific restriction endonuclease McrA